MCGVIFIPGIIGLKPSGINLAIILERFKLQRIIKWIQDKKSGLLTQFSLKADLR